MNEKSDMSPRSQLVASWTQVAALCITAGAVLVYIGRRDTQIETTGLQVRELTVIVGDLMRAQAVGSLKLDQTQERLREVVQRLDAMERNPRR